MKSGNPKMTSYQHFSRLFNIIFNLIILIFPFAINNFSTGQDDTSGLDIIQTRLWGIYPEDDAGTEKASIIAIN
jgi:hypothetical protein